MVEGWRARDGFTKIASTSTACRVSMHTPLSRNGEVVGEDVPRRIGAVAPRCGAHAIRNEPTTMTFPYLPHADAAAFNNCFLQQHPSEASTTHPSGTLTVDTTRHGHPLRLALIEIASLPRRWRRKVEELYVTCLASEPALASTAAVDYEAEFFTAWRSDPWTRTVACEQLVSATLGEVNSLNRALEDLQRQCPPGTTARCVLVS